MLDRLQLRGLRRLQRRFASLAEKHEESRHYVFVNDEGRNHKGPELSVDQGFGGIEGFEHFFFTAEGDPRPWWYCRLDGSHKAYDAFIETSKLAGAIVKGAFDDALRLEGVDMRDDDYWIVLLYCGAWKRVPGSPLRAFNEILTESHGWVSTDDAHPQQLGLRTELAIDPFTASVCVIDLLVEGRFPDKKRERKNPPKSSEKDLLLEGWGVKGSARARRLSVVRHLLQLRGGEREKAASLAHRAGIRKHFSPEQDAGARQECVARDCRAMAAIIEGGRGEGGYRIHSKVRHKVKDVLGKE